MILWKIGKRKTNTTTPLTPTWCDKPSQNKNRKTWQTGVLKQDFWPFCVQMYLYQPRCVYPSKRSRTLHLVTLSAQCNCNNHCTWLDIPYRAMLTDVVWITQDNIAIMIHEQLTHRQAAYVVGQESSSKPNKTQRVNTGCHKSTFQWDKWHGFFSTNGLC